MAAKEERSDLSYEEVLEETRACIESHDFSLVEGIGGVRVPLADEREVIDLIEDLGLPVLIVARSGLGTLNHTSLTVESL